MFRLRDFEDHNARGTLGKNRQIYTSLYDYHASKSNREHMVGWVADDSQIRNFTHVLPHIEEGDSILDFGCGLGDLVPFLWSNIDDFSYMGVDINEKFVDEAARSYPDFDFRLIDSPDDVEGEFDVVVAIGVFTWYITRPEFRRTIMSLHSLCRKRVVITCLHTSMAKHSWTRTYRGYDEDVFRRALPELAGQMSFEVVGPDLVVTIDKLPTEVTESVVWGAFPGILRYGEMNEDYEIRGLSLILEDASIPLAERVGQVIQKLSRLTRAAKRRVIPMLVSLATAMGSTFNLEAEVRSVDPEAADIVREIEGGGVEELAPAPGLSAGGSPEGAAEAIAITEYGYNLDLSSGSEKWLRSTYLGSRPTQQEVRSFNSALAESKEGVAKIFKDWKASGIHIRVTQEMYDAIVMIALRGGVTPLRQSNFIQEVKRGRHLQATRLIPKINQNRLGLAPTKVLVNKEIGLYKSYLRNEISKDKSGVKVEVPKGYTVHGIDVSKYQGTIDWGKVKQMNTKSGINIDFVFVKATRGEKVVDPKFKANWAATDKHGIARGAYHYFQPGVSGEKQARNFIRNVKLSPGDLPPVLDFEEKAPSREAMIWLKMVEKHYGVRPIIYTGATFYRDNLGSDFDGYPLWVSHGPFGKSTDLNIPGPAVSRKWAFWQFSDKARLPGIVGDVDLNVFNGDKSQLNAYLIKPEPKPASRSGHKTTKSQKSPAKVTKHGNKSRGRN